MNINIKYNNNVIMINIFFLYQIIMNDIYKY